jgi:hypothetical protein
MRQRVMICSFLLVWWAPRIATAQPTTWASYSSRTLEREAGASLRKGDVNSLERSIALSKVLVDRYDDSPISEHIEFLARNYERIGHAYLALAQVDSALMYFGAAETIRHPDRITELTAFLQLSPLDDASKSDAERETYTRLVRSALTEMIPSDALLGIPTTSAGEVEDALQLMLPPADVDVVVKSSPTGLAVRYRETRSNPRFKPGEYATITTDTTIHRPRAKLQFCYIDSGQPRGFVVPCQTGCTVHLPQPIQWTSPCEDR